MPWGLLVVAEAYWFGTVVAMKLKRRPNAIRGCTSVGIATTADVEAMQQTVQTRRDQIQAVVQACTWEATRPTVYTQWMAEYEKASAYVNLTPSLLDASTQVAQGQALLSELDTWATTIAAAPECANAGAMPPAPVVPVPTPDPSSGGFLGSLSSLFSQASALELVAGVLLLVYLTDKSK